MSFIPKFLPALVLLANSEFSAKAVAGYFDPVTYELLEGSFFLEDCYCGRPPLGFALRGTMILTGQPVRMKGELYLVSDIDFRTIPLHPDEKPKYIVKGSGSLLRRDGDLNEEFMKLEVNVNGQGGFIFENNQLPVNTPTLWPTLRFYLREKDPPDLPDYYSIQIEARPISLGGEFRRGDVDGNRKVELTDVIKALDYQFSEGVAIDCLDAADVDDDGELTLTDAIRSLNYQFTGTASVPEPPGPFTCGPDVNDDAFPLCEYPVESCK